MNERSVPDEARHAHQSRLRRSAVAAVKRWLREPLLHFLLLGVALFVANGYFEPRVGAADASKEIRLTPDELLQLAAYFQSQWRRPPTMEEFSRLVDDKVRRGGALPGRRRHGARQGRHHRQAPHGAEDAVPGRGRGDPAGAGPGRARGVVRRERRHVRAARPHQLPADLLFAGPARRPCARRRGEGARAARRPAGRLEDRGLGRRSVHAAGLLRRPLAGPGRQGVRPGVRAGGVPRQARRLARADRIRLRLAPRLRRFVRCRGACRPSPRSSPT